jgi:hypothetical protein
MVNGIKMKWTILFACVLTVTFADAEAPQAWRNKMGQLANALAEAIPYLYPSPDQDPKMLAEKVRRIYEITKTLDGKLDHAQLPDSDPALPYIAGLLKDDIERASESLKEGHTEYAKGVVRSSVAYCIACHTRTKGGAEFPLLKAFNEPLKRGSWIERIEMQAATRQFEPVISEVMAQLEKKDSKAMSSLDLERAARIALSVAVRAKQDPERARALAQAVLKSPSSTYTMKESAAVWLKDISAWQNEKDKKFASDKEALEAARKLVQAGQNAELPIGVHAEVKFLRASVMMHDLLKKPLSDEQSAEALYIIGLSYDALRELGLWSLHEMYYLTCIKNAPHTVQAERCYARYDESVTMGYTGSSGIHIPKEVRDHLARTKKLAQVQAK